MLCHFEKELFLLNSFRTKSNQKKIETNLETGSWRTQWHAKRDGNLYPTHGLGPVSQYMNINRGDRFDFLTSMSSPSLGRSAYAQREFAADHSRNQLNYIAGDMNTTLIKTLKGRSIMVQHDTTTPRPYSRHNLIQGTNGVFAGFPNRIALENGNQLGMQFPIYVLLTKMDLVAGFNAGSSSSPDTSKWIFTCVKIRGAVSRRSVVSLALTDTTFWPALFKPSTTSTELQPPAAISTISIGLGAVAPPLPSITIE